jgi:hypothetical protein
LAGHEVKRRAHGHDWAGAIRAVGRARDLAGGEVFVHQPDGEETVWTPVQRELAYRYDRLLRDRFFGTARRGARDDSYGAGWLGVVRVVFDLHNPTTRLAIWLSPGCYRILGVGWYDRFFVDSADVHSESGLAFKAALTALVAFHILFIKTADLDQRRR